jgi:hypothetical protein
MITYRKWEIRQSDHPLHNWIATSPDYDVEYTQEFGAEHSGTILFDDTISELKAQIDEEENAADSDHVVPHHRLDSVNPADLCGDYEGDPA